MIISTTSQLEGRPVAEYLGVVSAESVQGSTSCAIFYTLSRRLRRPFANPGRRTEAGPRAGHRGVAGAGTAVASRCSAGWDFEISMPSVQGGMVVVFATGTAVRLK
jgi:hypothetical protein